MRTTIVVLAVAALSCSKNSRKGGTNSPSPTASPSPSVSAIPPTAGGHHNTMGGTRVFCARGKGDEVRCAGQMEKGNTIVGSRVVPELAGAFELGGAGIMVCGRTPGALRCVTFDGVNAPVAATLRPPAPAAQISINEMGGCLLTDAATTACWGSYPGDGTIREGGEGMRTLALAGVKQVSVGREHRCALLASGEVQCWGEESAFAPDGTCHESDCMGCGPLPPGAVGRAPGRHAGALQLAGPPRILRICAKPTGFGLDHVAELATGSGFTCARKDDGSVVCAGHGNWYLIQAGGAFTTPTAIAGVDHAVELVAGESHACARVNDGTVRCWGDNQYGQLGLGSTDQGGMQARPVPGLDHVVELSALSHGTCARRDDGSMRCWGMNENGQFGVTTDTFASSPIAAGF